MATKQPGLDQHNWFHNHGPIDPHCCWCIENQNKDKLITKLREENAQAMTHIKALLPERKKPKTALEKIQAYMPKAEKDARTFLKQQGERGRDR